MNKRDRQEAIKQIISSLQVDSQEKLSTLLLSKGIDVTQATLSRDIKEMQIIKAPTRDGTYAYQLTKSTIPVNVGNSNLTSFGFLSINFSGNLAVIKTRPGYAMGIAGEIDAKITEEILGTVAGDDTILLIIKEGVSHEQVTEALKKLGDII